MQARQGVNIMPDRQMYPPLMNTFLRAVIDQERRKKEYRKQLAKEQSAKEQELEKEKRAQSTWEERQRILQGYKPPTSALGDTLISIENRVASGTATPEDMKRYRTLKEFTTPPKEKEPLRPSQALTDTLAARKLRGDWAGVEALQPPEERAKLAETEARRKKSDYEKALNTLADAVEKSNNMLNAGIDSTTVKNTFEPIINNARNIIAEYKSEQDLDLLTKKHSPSQYPVGTIVVSPSRKRYKSDGTKWNLIEE